MSTLQFTKAAVLSLLLAGLVAACGNGNQKDTLSGSLGPGAGGPPYLSGGTQVQTLLKPDGTLLGSMTYDPVFFTPDVPAPAQPHILANATNNLGIALTPISGRADTPCRFNAATLARDQGYQIDDATGFLTNANGQDLYQVTLTAPGTELRLFCANISGNAGLQFAIATNVPAELSWLEVYGVMNSINP